MAVYVLCGETAACIRPSHSVTPLRWDRAGEWVARDQRRALKTCTEQERTLQVEEAERRELKGVEGEKEELRW